MDKIFAIALAYPLGLGLAALGSAFGLGRAVGAAMEAMGRQPEAAGKIQTAMIIGLALIESLVIYALLMFFMLKPLLPTVAQAAKVAGVDLG